VARTIPDACEWIGRREAFRRFATYTGRTESARHIKPLHWYIACRLVLEGGFHPDEITPRPPFVVSRRNIIAFSPGSAGAGEQILFGGLKTKNVDIVVNKIGIGPVLAISCKGVTKAFRNLTNRMEETIGECTNLHITYPAMVIGYFVLMRANRTIEDALEAPDLPSDDTPVSDDEPVTVSDAPAASITRIEANDIAIRATGEPVESIQRFHAALSELTRRRGIRDEISRYEAISLALIEPHGDRAGHIVSGYPPSESPLRLERFFTTLYQQYEERFVYGAPALAGRTRRVIWSADSPLFQAAGGRTVDWEDFEYFPRLP
jgi:hypothetical protein